MKTRLISVLAVLALNLTILANLTGRYDNLDNFTFSDGTVCGLKGTAKSNTSKSLNLFKNRYDPPDAVDMDDTITLSKMLKPGDDLDRFNPSFGARITGYVADVKFGGTTETCNCGQRLPEDRDTHIELSLYPNAPNIERIVIEVTPRMREIQRLKGIDWSTKTLSGNNPANPDGKIKGKWVEVIGWMMFDTMHVNEAENTNPGNASNWRASCWEIHPITAMRILPDPPHPVNDNLALAIGNDNTLLFKAQKNYRLSLTTQKRQVLKARNEKLLSRFASADMERDDQ